MQASAYLQVLIITEYHLSLLLIMRASNLRFNRRVRVHFRIPITAIAEILIYLPLLHANS